MKISALIPVSIVVIMITAALTFSASAGCSTCSKEEDWTKSATSFLEGIPINETQQDYGPKAARMTSSQFEKNPGPIRRTRKHCNCRSRSDGTHCYREFRSPPLSW